MTTTTFISVCLFLLLKGVNCEEVWAVVGSGAVLPCRSTPQTVSPAVAWSNSNGSIWRMQRSGLQFWSLRWMSRARCPHTQFPLGDYSLHIQRVTEEDAGPYSCTLELGDRRRPRTTRVTLRVIKVSLWPSAPVVGQSVSIGCSVSGGEEPTRVRWMFNTRPYEEEETRGRGGVGVGGGVRGGVGGGVRGGVRGEVRIKASERLRGNWTCVVSSRGHEGSATALLDVKGIVQPPDDTAQVFAAVGSAVALPCVFSPGLTPNASWDRTRDGPSGPSAGTLPPSFSPASALVSTRDQTARLNEVRFEDAGRYRCSATVQGQRLERRVQLVTARVEVAGSNAEVKLTCRLSDSSAVTAYQWLYVTSDLNGTEFTASVQSGQTVSVGGASGGAWTCCFYGQQGLLGNVTHHVLRMEGQREDVPALASRGAALLLSGLSLLILALLLVLMKMYKNNQRSKKVLQFPALETILHLNALERERNERRHALK
ncbi:lymphocyte activation gene 3 protein-like [Eucyclogobius newberryi]|uniref:lymphocyte activation gene 3 protein-like n=1 Tax=Eucyclogobius newberryi TaxID=166745 RepID=UPI003B5CE040